LKHPGEIELALFAGGDLGFRERWRIRKHVRVCQDCRNEVEALKLASAVVRDVADEMPEGVNWTRLSQEMTGNIRVGFAAGECVGPVPSERPQGLGWHAAAVIAAAFVIVLGAMWLNMPRDEWKHSRLTGPTQTAAVMRPLNLPDGVVLEASPASIGVKSNGGTMSLLTSRSEGVAVSVSMQGSADAQFVDSDTGQVTINRVYYAQ
jgi:hypothetical protein